MRISAIVILGVYTAFIYIRVVYTCIHYTSELLTAACNLAMDVCYHHCMHNPLMDAALSLAH